MFNCSNLSQATANIHECIQWQSRHYFSPKNPMDVLPEALIAPSRNLLQSSVFKDREAIDLSTIDFPTISMQNGLQPPVQYKSASATNHCVSMSLDFIKKARAYESLELAAETMKDGADADCALCSMAYDALLEANMYSSDTEEVLLDKLRSAAANVCGLSLGKEITLNMSPKEILSYLKNKMEPGEYIIRLPGHVASLIKNDKGLFLFDANQGTIDLAKAGDVWVMDFFAEYRINISERLTLIKVQGNQLDELESNCKEEIMSEHDLPPELKYRPLEQVSDRWEIAEFTHQDKTYHFVKDKLTGLIYNDNSQKAIRIKFALLIPRNIVENTLRTVYHTAMTAINLLKLSFSIVRGREKRLDCIERIKQSSRDILRVPILGIVGAFIAIYGVIKPYEGRRLYGRLERSLNRQNDHVNFFKKYYIAPCFIPVNFNSNGTDEDQIKEALKKYVIKMEGFNKHFMYNLFRGCFKTFKCL